MDFRAEAEGQIVPTRVCGAPLAKHRVYGLDPPATRTSNVAAAGRRRPLKLAMNSRIEGCIILDEMRRDDLSAMCDGPVPAVMINNEVQRTGRAPDVQRIVVWSSYGPQPAAIGATVAINPDVDQTIQPALGRLLNVLAPAHDGIGRQPLEPVDHLGGQITLIGLGHTDEGTGKVGTNVEVGRSSHPGIRTEGRNRMLTERGQGTHR